MLRTLIFTSWILVLCSIGLSLATDCTSTTFNQDLDAAQLALSQISANDYASITEEQITNKLKELFNETAVNINCTVTKTNNAVSIAYKVIYACNETLTTVQPDGSNKTKTVNTKVDTSKVHQAISCGKFDD